MLPLDDPLWKKLDDAHRDREIPEIVRALSERWDDDAATSLFWDCLCHQETCYGATYAVIPHLLKIAEPDANTHQRLEIALFLGFVALCAFQPGCGCSGEEEKAFPRGLPQALDAWDRKLDTYRSLVAHLESDRNLTPYEQNELVRYHKILTIEPVNESDLDQIKAIATGFLDALPEIRVLCERAFRENTHDEEAAPYLLGGVAAADGHFGLARLLHSGSEGVFKCPECEWTFEYLQFGDRIAIYALDRAPREAGVRSRDKDSSLLDYKAGAATRCDGFIVPIGTADDAPDRRIATLIELAQSAPDERAAILLRHFLGRFACPKCGADGPVAGR